MFSRPTEHAIRAMTFLAALPPGSLGGAREIADQERIPAAFLWKILHTLTRKKLIRSFKGVHGGYELARPAKRITLAQVIHAMDDARGRHCLLGFPGCGPQRPCPLRPIENQLQLALQRTTLAEVARPPRRTNHRKPSR